MRSDTFHIANPTGRILLQGYCERRLRAAFIYTWVKVASAPAPEDGKNSIHHNYVYLTLGAHAQRGLRLFRLCVCACVRACVRVCLSAPFRPLRVKVSPETDTNASSRQDKENKTGDFLKNSPFQSYGVICTLCRHSAVL